MVGATCLGLWIPQGWKHGCRAQNHVSTSSRSRDIGKSLFMLINMLIRLIIKNAQQMNLSIRQCLSHQLMFIPFPSINLAGKTISKRFGVQEYGFRPPKQTNGFRDTSFCRNPRWPLLAILNLWICAWSYTFKNLINELPGVENVCRVKNGVSIISGSRDTFFFPNPRWPSAAILDLWINAWCYMLRPMLNEFLGGSKYGCRA